MAEVWCATDTRLERDVAVKFLDPRLIDDPEFLVRFFGEAQGVARISHPGVVRVLDFGQSDERPYLVMEYVGGGALAELVGEALTTERALEIVGQAARGAGAAHDSGIVHRDIKPANILLDESGDAKLADFGISANAVSERFTATGAAIGSPHYISPEQISGSPATPASDVYSLGVVLYELLTGERPFDGDNVTAIAIAHVDKEPEPPSKHDPDIDPAIDAIVLKCLSKDPKDRFKNGQALAAALDEMRTSSVAGAVGAVATGTISTIDEDDEPEAPSGLQRPRSALATAVVMVLLALAAAGVVSATDPGGAPAEAQAEATELEDEDDRKKPSPSPTTNNTTAEVAPVASPTPEKEEKKKEKDTSSSDPTTAEQPAEEPKEEPTEPEPEPSPTPDAQPSAEPSPNGTSGGSTSGGSTSEGSSGSNGTATNEEQTSP